MYRYDEFDHAFVTERVADFKDQVVLRTSKPTGGWKGPSRVCTKK